MRYSASGEQAPEVAAWRTPPPLPPRARRMLWFEIVALFSVSLGALIGGCGLGLYYLAFRAGISLNIVAAGACRTSGGGSRCWC